MMRVIQRAAICAVLAVGGLAPSAAAAASAVDAPVTAGAAASAIRVKATIPVAAAQVVAVNPLTRAVYVAGDFNDNRALSVINGKTNTVTATITLGNPVTGFEPSAIAVNPLTG